jgi:hypothetical protein
LSRSATRAIGSNRPAESASSPWLSPLLPAYFNAYVAFAHIPTGTATDEGFDIDDLRSRLAVPAVAQIAIGADIEIGGAIP